ncbi:MAG: extracellular solute-binding protein [Alphaproteobacteria bacterium]|nr:extracellular solute-binding protein [Alphaproteobacteria bacterium]
MDVLDQLGALREGKLSRRAFSRSLFAMGITTAIVPIVPRKAWAAPEDQATLFTYGGYNTPELFEEYIAKHGEEPAYATFGAAAEAMNKLKSGFVPDVAHACHSDVPAWTSTGMFQPIDTTRLSNWADVIPALWQRDYNIPAEGQVWQSPFNWGQTSIAYRTDLFELDGEESWDMLWDERYAGKLGMLAGAGDVWWCAAIKAGVPYDQIHTEEAFEKISAVLRAQRPLIRMYTDDTTQSDTALAAGELVATMAWNYSAVWLKAAGNPVKFAQPKEGAMTYNCGLMLMKDAPKVDKAYDIIDAILSKSASATNLSWGYGGVNRKAYDDLSDEQLADINLSRDPMAIIKAGHLSVPQTPEWEQRMSATWEQIKLGF